MIKVKNSIVFGTFDSRKNNAEIIEITSYLFYFLEAIYDEICTSKKYYNSVYAILCRKEQKQHILNLEKYIANIYNSLNILENAWRNPRISGVLDRKIAHENQRLVESIKKNTVEKLNTNITSWRLISLSLIGDRLQPAHLLIPYIKQNNIDLPKLHSYIYDLTQKLRSIEKYLEENKEIIHNFCYRMRGLCLSIEENAPKETQFDFRYSE